MNPKNHSSQQNPLPFSLVDMVEPIHKRAPESALGPFYVWSDQCIICDLPPQTAPANIKLLHTDNCENCSNYCYVHQQPTTLEDLDKMIEAMSGSCIEAVRYCGTDEYILRRLTNAGLKHLCDALK